VTVTFIRLSRLLTVRSRRSKQPSEVRYSVKCLRYLRDRSLQVEAFDITPPTRSEVTTSLVHALALQVELGHGDAMRGIEEMSVLCRELHSSDASEQRLNTAVESFARGILIHMKDTLDQPSQQVIEYLYEANTRLPDLHSASLALSLALSLCFYATKSPDDYERVMGHIDKIIASLSPVGSPSETLNLREHLSQAAGFAVLRDAYYSNPEHLEEAISRTRAYLGFVPIEDTEHRKVIQSLAQLVRRRAKEFGDTDVPKQKKSLTDEIFI